MGCEPGFFRGTQEVLNLRDIFKLCRLGLRHRVSPLRPQYYEAQQYPSCWSWRGYGSCREATVYNLHFNRAQVCVQAGR